MTKKSEAASKEVAEVGQARIDRVIWRGIGVKSVRAIAEEAGIKPEEVLRRKGEMLDEIDVLSVAEKRIRIMAELEGMARDARERAARVSDEFASGMLNSSVAAMKTVLGELARMEKADNGKVEALNQLRRQEILRLIDSAVRKTFASISAEHGIPEGDLMAEFQSSLTEAARELEP